MITRKKLHLSAKLCCVYGYTLSQNRLARQRIDGDSRSQRSHMLGAGVVGIKERLHKARCNKENGCQPSAGTGRYPDYPNRHYLSLQPCAQVPSIYLMIGSAHSLALFATSVRTKRRRRGDGRLMSLFCRSLPLKGFFGCATYSVLHIFIAFRRY